VLPATVAIGILAMALSAGASLLVATSGGQGGADLSAALGSPWSLVAGLLVAQIVMILLAVFAAGLFSSNRAETLALRRPVGGWRVLPLSLIPLFVVTGVWTAIVSMWRPDVVVEDLRLFKTLLEGDTAPFALLAISIGAPVSEELLVRGFLFSGLAKSRLGLLGASVVTTLLWTIVHGYSLFGLIEVMAIGFYFCWLLVRTGSLWVTLFCHAVYNTVVGLALYFITLPAVPG
jgi:membrane protease YdiL (CAAX protease family)